MQAGTEASVTDVDYHGFKAVVYSNGWLQVTVLPEVGAKVISLIDLRSNQEWLTAPTRPIRRLNDVDDRWEEYDRSGWDECFPSVSGGYYPAGPWAGTPVRDMGELWHRPWQRKDSSGVFTSIHGLRFPYEFSRQLRLNGDTLEITYSVRNFAEVPLLGLWSMHPLFAAHPGLRILFPSGTTMVIESAVEDNAQDRYRERLVWPTLDRNGTTDDLSLIRSPDRGRALKLFTERQQVARTALCDPGSGAWLGLHVDPATVPHYGLWLNEGRWPRPEEDLFHVALEATNGCADSLEVAAALGSGLHIPGQSARGWTLSMVFGTGADDARAFVNRGQAAVSSPQ
jgi:hypothetical protein